MTFKTISTDLLNGNYDKLFTTSPVSGTQITLTLSWLHFIHIETSLEVVVPVDSDLVRCIMTLTNDSFTYDFQQLASQKAAVQLDDSCVSCIYSGFSHSCSRSFIINI